MNISLTADIKPPAAAATESTDNSAADKDADDPTSRYVYVSIWICTLYPDMMHMNHTSRFFGFDCNLLMLSGPILNFSTEYTNLGYIYKILPDVGNIPNYTIN